MRGIAANMADFKPYVKGMVGRGDFHFADNFVSNPVTEGFNNPQGGETSGYNLIAGAGGVDLPVSPRINVRAELEYQHWFAGYNLENALTPILYSVGVAYHLTPAGPASSPALLSNRPSAQAEGLFIHNPSIGRGWISFSPKTLSSPKICGKIAN